MAAAKKSTGKPQTASSKALIPWQEQMARDAEIAKAITGVASGTFISFKGGIISVDKSPVPSNKLEAIILAHIFENAYYIGKYDPDNPQPPVCFAFGTVQDDMKPHELSSDPQGHMDPADAGKPGGACATCWANQWASAEQGRGKACKNLRRLGMIAGDDAAIETEESIAGQKVHYAKTPVTSAAAWDGYVKNVADTLHRPPMGVVTQIGAVPDAKTQFRVTFDIKDTINTGEQYEALAKRAKEVNNAITFPYQPMTEEPAQPASRATTNQKFRAAPVPPARRGAPSRPAAPARGRR